jgi:uncharacterized phage-associated protein
MAYDVFSVSNEFLRLAREDQTSIDPLKLQKLVYLSHGWNLAFTGNPLIRDVVEAWTYGPVIPRLYREYREFKASPVTRDAKISSPVVLDNVARELIKNVWSTYKQYSPIALSMLTHEAGSAWDIVRRGAGEWITPVIPNELIKQEFLSRKQNSGQLRQSSRVQYASAV